MTNRKRDKYVDWATTHLFAMKSIGPFCTEGITFLKELGRRMTIATGEMRQTAYQFQKLSVVAQHLNRVLLRCSLGATVYDDEDYV